jgi:diguanylate cyclase (GGDEF)-like protein/PAS domain S-box-containing protein
MKKEGLRVLLVAEDGSELAPIFADIAEVECCDSGDLGQPLLELREGDGRVVVVDGGEAPIDVLRWLRQLPVHLGSIPVVLLCAECDDDFFAEARECGVADVVSKRDHGPDSLKRALNFAKERATQTGTLRALQSRLSLLHQGSRDGLWEWDFQNDAMSFSLRWCETLGYDWDDVTEAPDAWWVLIHPADKIRVENVIRQARKGEKHRFEIEHRIQHRDGTYRWVLLTGVTARGLAGNVLRIAGSMTDLSAQKDAEQQAVQARLMDGLTGLPNRILLLDRIERAMMRSRRYKDQIFALLHVDIDRFQLVNDSYGTEVGDRVLLEMAERLNNCLRETDSVARVTGDGFVVLLDVIRDVADVRFVLDRIRSVAAELFFIGDHEVEVTLSIGVAFGFPDSQKAESLLRDAETAMRKAKSEGRDRHVVFGSTMRTKTSELVRLEADLRHGIERGELVLHYQPIITLGSGEINGFEALVRWKHPQRGMVPPGDFIELAEESGVIVPLGAWVLEEACRQANAWQDLSSGRRTAISVNLSAKQFQRADLVKQVENAIGSTGLDPGLLKLEITETALMHRAESSSSALTRLRDLAVEVQIDDFGTGYSSLDYLTRLAVDTLKIDRSFVNGLGSSEEFGKVVRGIVSLAHSLGLGVIAEGVETLEQLSFLRDLSCEGAQGFYFAKPLTAEDATELIRSPPKW